VSGAGMTVPEFDFGDDRSRERGDEGVADLIGDLDRAVGLSHGVVETVPRGAERLKPAQVRLNLRVGHLSVRIDRLSGESFRDLTVAGFPFEVRQMKGDPRPACASSSIARAIDACWIPWP
jgi:hypothetical protein